MRSLASLGEKFGWKALHLLALSLYLLLGLSAGAAIDVGHLPQHTSAELAHLSGANRNQTDAKSDEAVLRADVVPVAGASPVPAAFQRSPLSDAHDSFTLKLPDSGFAIAPWVIASVSLNEPRLIWWSGDDVGGIGRWHRTVQLLT